MSGAKQVFGPRLKLKAREARAAEALGESLFARMLLDLAEHELRASAAGDPEDEHYDPAAAQLLWAELWELRFRLLPYTRAKVRAPAPPMQIRSEGPVEIIFGGEDDGEEAEG